MTPHKDSHQHTGDGPTTIVFSRPTLRQRIWLTDALRDETVGGIVLLGAAVLALIMANSGAADLYVTMASTEIGPVINAGPIHLDLNLSVATWAADGLLAIFFFVAGVELRHELELGSLSDPARAAVPMAAAIGGMVVPAAIYFATNALHPQGEPVGWGIPMATDIAFALAVLAVIGKNLPTALRAFLLTLAVVDDLGAIIVIALFYTEVFNLGAFGVATALLAVYGVLQWRRFRAWPVYVALAVAAWAFMHESGIHATIAGVAAGMLTRAKPDPGEDESPGQRAEHVIRPMSAGLAVPLFAFFSAGVSLSGFSVSEYLTNPIAIGVVLGLVLGKPIGIIGTAALMARYTRAELSKEIGWPDVAAVGLLGGIGFTVSMLIAELAFDDKPLALSAAKLSILAASALASVLAAMVILTRNRHYRPTVEAEEEHYTSELRSISMPPPEPETGS